jgi:hypothetical protein
MTDLGELPDEELLTYAHEWRKRAMHGDKDARGIAHSLEAEARRRFGAPTTSAASLDTRPLVGRSRPWWRIW